MVDKKVSDWHAELKIDLTKNAKSSDKIWSERYMKGIIPFHGVKVPQVRILTSALIKKHELKSWNEKSIYDLVKQLLSSEFSEEKLSGISVLSSKSLTFNDWEEQLRLIKSSFKSGQIEDWATCDQVKMYFNFRNFLE